MPSVKQMLYFILVPRAGKLPIVGSCREVLGGISASMGLMPTRPTKERLLCGAIGTASKVATIAFLARISGVDFDDGDTPLRRAPLNLTRQMREMAGANKYRKVLGLVAHRAATSPLDDYPLLGVVGVELIDTAVNLLPHVAAEAKILGTGQLGNTTLLQTSTEFGFALAFGALTLQPLPEPLVERTVPLAAGGGDEVGNPDIYPHHLGIRWGSVRYIGIVSKRQPPTAIVAQHSLHGPVAGHADILIVPDIEAGNTLAKGLTYFAHAVSASVVVGATAPIVLTSRSDSAESKLASIALGAMLASEAIS